MSNISDMIGLAATYEGLAEECIELAHAALKAARLIRGDNPTPADPVEVTSSVFEEFADVLWYTRALQLFVSPKALDKRTDRFVHRMNWACPPGTWLCDPGKALTCPKTTCFYSGAGACFSTTNPDWRRDEKSSMEEVQDAE